MPPLGCGAEAVEKLGTEVAKVSFICKRALLCIFGPGVNLDKEGYAEIE